MCSTYGLHKLSQMQQAQMRALLEVQVDDPGCGMQVSQASGHIQRYLLASLPPDKGLGLVHVVQGVPQVCDEQFLNQAQLALHHFTT